MIVDLKATKDWWFIVNQQSSIGNFGFVC